MRYKMGGEIKKNINNTQTYIHIQNQKINRHMHTQITTQNRHTGKNM